MRWTHLARNVCLGVSLLCLGLPEAEALEIFAPPSVAAHMDDGLITQVRAGRGGGDAPRRWNASRRRRNASRRWGVSRWRGLPWGSPSRRRLSWRDGLPWGRVPRWRLPWRGGLPRRRLSWRGLSRRRVSRRRLPLWRLDPSRVRLGAWRSHSGRRGAWLCQRGGGGVLGGRRSRAGPLLVLHRPEPAAGLLGRLPVSPRPGDRLGLAQARTAGLEVTASRGVGVSNALAGPEGVVQRASDRSTTARSETSATSERSARSIDHLRNKSYMIDQYIC